MPELPEVETTRRGIEPYILGKKIDRVLIREQRLRWPIAKNLASILNGLTVRDVSRRAKYLLIDAGQGTLIIHLGMSGSLRILANGQPPKKHDHLDIIFDDNTFLRFNDPRRFGAVLWTESPISEHHLLASLGPEPFSDEFNGERLYRLSENRKTAVKSFIMDNHIVVGVGNIYANEALFKSGIHPNRRAGRISLARYRLLAGNIRNVLDQAIQKGGTTLRDFVNESGKPGYFRQSLAVYGRKDKPCTVCSEPIKQLRIGQRMSYFCPVCQK